MGRKLTGLYQPTPQKLEITMKFWPWIPGILNSQKIKSDFSSKMLTFNMGFTSYQTCLESLENHYPVDSAIHVSTTNRMLFRALISTGCIKKNGAHLLCLIIPKLLKHIAQFWTCFKPRSFLFRTSRNSYFYSQ